MVLDVVTVKYVNKIIHSNNTYLHPSMYHKMPSQGKEVKVSKIIIAWNEEIC